MADEIVAGNAGDSPAPTDDEWRKAVDKLLDEDAQDPQRSFGRVWIGMRENKTDEQIAKEVGFRSKDNVKDYQIAISLIRGEREPAISELSRSRAQRCATYIRRFRQRLIVEDTLEENSGPARRLQMLMKECERQSGRKEVDQEDKDQKESRRNRAGEPGIYVYTLPHYEKHPVEAGVDEASTRTLYKVGMTEVDIKMRVKAQSSTALPEPPKLLRGYFPEGDNALGPIREVEEKLHKLLRAADHRPNREKGAGKEWFLTSLIFLDALAEALGLERSEMD